MRKKASFLLWFVSALLVVSALAQEKHGTNQSIDEVLRALDGSRSGGELIAARNKLRSLGKEAAPELRAYVTDTKHDGRKRAMAFGRLMEGLSATERITELRSVLTDKDATFRSHCLLEAGQLKDQALKPILKRVIESSKEQAVVQLSAAIALAAMGDQSGKQRAIRAVINNEYAADLGINVLESLDAQDARQIIRDKLPSARSEPAQATLHLAILRLDMVKKTSAEKTILLEQSLRTNKSIRVRQWAAWHLAQIGDERAAKALLKVLKTGSPESRESASRGLQIGMQEGRWTQADIRKWSP
ncbi:MAG: HEAT repeat domain-containing protein [Elusimicrobia bacterium]|nr:HEAT repeat domain-containing protein [Elusimicrobiota bacterium]